MIKVQWVIIVTMSGLCSQTIKILRKIVSAATRKSRLHHSVCCRFTKSVIGSVGCPRWGQWTWFLSTLKWRSMAHTTYYRKVLLTVKLLPVMREICGEFFIFQQGSVPAHRACETISKTPAFISSDLWPPIAQIWTRLTTKYWENAAASVLFAYIMICFCLYLCRMFWGNKCFHSFIHSSSWCRRTEAALDRCLTSFRAKSYR